MHSKINNYNNIEFEWVPYGQFDKINEVSSGDYATIHSAIWKDGPLYFNPLHHYNKWKYARKSNKKVVLKYLYNSHKITDEFLYKV